MLTAIKNIAKKIHQKTKSDTTLLDHAGDWLDIGMGLTKRRDPLGPIYDRKLTGLGKTTLVGLGFLGFADAMTDERDLNDMGRTDGTIHYATPSMASYMHAPDISAGASGSLVFALNNSRETGFLG